MRTTIKILSPGAILLTLLVAPKAYASSSAAGEEFLSVAEAVEPNVLFLIDVSEDITTSVCPDLDGTSTTTDNCIVSIANAIDQITQHFNWARYGVITTSDSSDGFEEIVALGATHSEVTDALDEMVDDLDGVSYTTDRNLAEALADVAVNYFTNTTEDDLEADADGDGYLSDFTAAPIQYHCQENYIIVITVDQPTGDSNPIDFEDPISDDVICAADGSISSSPEIECYYDNVVADLYSSDYRSDLSGDQNIIVHTIAVGLDSTAKSVAENLFGNAADNTSGEGIYNVPANDEEILGSILIMMSDIRSGFHSRSSPVISTDGDYLLYAFYEIDGDNPLAEGHIRAYSLITDPTDPDYGEVDYTTYASEGYDGAYWDGGDLLVSRLVIENEYNPNYREGWGQRDIYTFVDEMVGTSVGAGSNTETNPLKTRRMDYDYSFSSALASDTTLYTHFMDTTKLKYDLSQDGVVDHADVQDLIDFTRGLPDATYRYLDKVRGNWKLGDSPHSTPVVVSGRMGIFTPDPSYQNFLNTQANDSNAPAMVYIAANDGMLHAFFLEDNSSTSLTEQGEEAWAWVPAYLTYHEHTAEWAGTLWDQVLYGRTFLFDGTPVVDDVWIDENADGAVDCPDELSSVSDLNGNCEWHRVLVVQQGQGGPVTLALEITDPENPKFLWEQVDERAASGTGYLVGRPVIAAVYDRRDTANPVHRWVAMWGSGRAVPYSDSTSYFANTEANLYMWAMGDDYFYGGTGEWNSSQEEIGFNTDGTNFTNSDGLVMNDGGSSGHPELATWGSALNVDGDSDDEGNPFYEYAYIAATLTVVDTDSDGDADVVYFPVTNTYGSGSPGTDTEDPGDTWMWKAVINSDDPEDIEWCSTAFWDPKVGYGGVGAIGSRPSVYYAATASWLTGGTLGLYWGTGTPYERDSTDPGYFFAIEDPDPENCSVGQPIDCQSIMGYYELGAGEGLTADPVIYAGVVYFTTYLPNTDRCELGVGKLYGLGYDDCGPGLDTDGDGSATSSDDDSVTVDGYPSGATVANGTIYVGSSGDGSSTALNTFSVATDPFMGTQTVSWMEIY